MKNNTNITNNINKTNNTNNSDNLQQARLSRHLAFQKYMAFSSDENVDDEQNKEIALILNELKECITMPDRASRRSGTVENVIAFQLSDSIEEFAKTLSLQNKNIFLKRYFYSESVATIADLYKMSENRVCDILEKCRLKLKSNLAAKSYIFKSETLYEGFTNISDKILSEQPQDSETTPDKKWIKPVAILGALSVVACIALILVIISKTSDSAPLSTDTDTTTSPPNITESAILDVLVDIESLPTEEQAAMFLSEDNYVDIYSLIEYQPEYPSDIIPATQIQLFNNSCCYEQCELRNNDILEYLISLPVNEIFDEDEFSVPFSDEQTSNWYFLAGYSDLQYIVEECDNEYSLWRFSYVYGDEYNTDTYDEILRNIYGICSSDDIFMLSGVSPYIHIGDQISTGGASYEGVATTDSDIDYIYYVMSQMTCLGNRSWILLTDYPEHTLDEIVSNSVNLLIFTEDGKILTNFYYSDLAGCFYELDTGIVYSKVSDDAKAKLYEIFYSDGFFENITYDVILSSYDIDSAEDISSIGIYTIIDEDDSTKSNMITDAATIKRVYDIVSNMTMSSSNAIDEYDDLSLSSPTVYQLMLFENGSSTEFLTYYGTYQCFDAGGTFYNPLSDEDASFLNSLFNDYLMTDEQTE